MKKIAIALGALVALSGMASAADLPSKKGAAVAPVAAPVAFSWTGAYIGLQGGYGWSHTSYYFNSTLNDVPHNGHGLALGARVGYNYQFANGFVAGLEAEGNGSWIKGSTFCPNASFSCGHKIRSFGSLDGRIGFAADRFLISATGGLALANVSYASTLISSNTLFGTGYSTTFTGWTLGAGVDYAITNNIVASLNYRYYDFGHKTAPVGALSGVTTTNVHPKLSTLMAGISYKF